MEYCLAVGDFKFGSPLTQGRWGGSKAGIVDHKFPKDGYPPLCPDFVVELRSLTDDLTELEFRMQEYIDNGAQLGWLINPQNCQVEIYRQGQQKDVLHSPVALSEENVMPGFVLNLERIWK